MPIPEFTKKGTLPPEVIYCDGNEFIERFCNNDFRKSYKKAVTDILDFAVESNALCLFFGGSFITNSSSPHDIDCLIIYGEDKHIPSIHEKVKVGNIRVDIMFASMEHMHIVNSYIKLFMTNRIGIQVGIIQIDLYEENNEWEIVHPGREEYEIIKRAYINRTVEDLNPCKGLLVTIHGLRSHAVWNQEIAPIASSQGWIFAPYIYDFQNVDLLFDTAKRRAIVDDFREWIYNLQNRYRENISVVAHSFGTYILASYLEGFEDPPVKFNSVILTGSIINPEFNWVKHIFRNASVARIYNEVAPNDKWVGFLPNTNYKKLFGMDPIMGNSGVNGFVQNYEPMMFESTNDIFDHNNVIKRDVIETKWMPFLDANQHAHWTNITEIMKYRMEEGLISPFSI